MKRTLRQRAARFAVALGAVAGVVSHTAPASAAHVDHPGQVLGVAGAASTEAFMSSYLNRANGDHNIPARPVGTYAVPGDAACGARNYTTANAAGSSLAGLDALVANPGCIDIARVSRQPFDEVEGLNFWAYGLDYVTWATPSFHAPASLSPADLRAIYACVATNWSQYGGTDRPIKPLLPPPGSGVREVFLRDVLNNVALGPCVGQTATVNSGRDAAVTGPDNQSVIMPYSSSSWIYQANNVASAVLDVRNGVRLGITRGACGVNTPTLPAIYNGSARRWFPNATPFVPAAQALVTEARAYQNFLFDTNGCGVTFVYNVTQDGSPQQALAEQHVGSGSDLCTGAASGQLVSAGLVPLATGPGIPPGVGDGTCRNYET